MKVYVMSRVEDGVEKSKHQRHQIKMKKKKVIYLEDLIKAINDLPNAPNGFSASYDKARIINMVEDIPTHYETTKKQ